MIGARLRARWDHVLVDEYQDVNQIQVDIVTGLCPDGAGLTVVGDDAQAVYGFRGARSGHLLELAATLPEATVVRLERNFRSVQPLLDLANVIRPGDEAQRITLHADRTGHRVRPRLLPCYDADAQARAVVEAVLQAHEDGQPLREQAVLMRAAGHSRELEVELSYRRVPYVKYGGLRFIDTAHVKDFLAVLRLLTNAGDEVAWFRLLQLHSSIGKARARALVTLSADMPRHTPCRHRHRRRGERSPSAAAPARARTALTATLTGVAPGPRPRPGGRPGTGRPAAAPAPRPRPLPGRSPAGRGSRPARRRGRDLPRPARVSSPSSPWTRPRPAPTTPNRPVSTTTT